MKKKIKFNSIDAFYSEFHRFIYSVLDYDNSQFSLNYDSVSAKIVLDVHIDMITSTILSFVSDYLPLDCLFYVYSYNGVFRLVIYKA